MPVTLFDGDAAEWDSFVVRQPGWTHFHLAGWREVITRALRHECLYHVARDESGAITGVLPAVRVRSMLFGHFVVSMPFLNYGGPLGAPAVQRALLDAAELRATADGAALFQVRARAELPTEMMAGLHKITVLVDLPAGGPDALFKQLGHKMRTKIRKAQKDGVEVRFGHEQIAPFHEVLSRHMRDLGTPFHSRRFFETIVETFPDSVWFAGAYLHGKVVAGGCGFVWRDEMEIAWSSSLRIPSGVRPGYQLHWAFLERAAQAGLRVANFGRSSPGSGTHEYKRQWGGRDEQLWWHYRSNGGAESTPSPDGGRFSWGPRIWRRLPVALTTRVGPLVVRGIP